MWWKGVKTGGDSGCTAASIGYPRRIRKGIIHSLCHTAVMESVSSNKNLAAWLPRAGVARMRAVAHLDVSKEQCTRAADILAKLIERG